jgi:hypothetical protein
MSSCEPCLEERAGHVIFRYLLFVEHDRAKEHLLTLPVLNVFERRSPGRLEIITVSNVCFGYEEVILVMEDERTHRMIARAFLSTAQEQKT